MSTTQKKKLCWNCEGRVPLDSENCPYCAVYLGPALNEKGGGNILAPPYKIIEAEEQEESLPDVPYIPTEESQEKQETQAVPVAAKSELKEVLLPLMLLSGGALFSLFGLILMFFSENGVLNLQWNGEYWYVYISAALPMLLLGWRYLRKFDVEEHQSSSQTQS